MKELQWLNHVHAWSTLTKNIFSYYLTLYYYFPVPGFAWQRRAATYYYYCVICTYVRTI